VNRALTVDKIQVGMGFFSRDVFIRVMDEFQKESTPPVSPAARRRSRSGQDHQAKMEYAFQLSPNATTSRVGGAAVAMQ